MDRSKGAHDRRELTKVLTNWDGNLNVKYRENSVSQLIWVSFAKSITLVKY